MDGPSIPSPLPQPPPIPTAGFFPNAQHFTINGGQFVSGNYANQVYNIISRRDAVFELLEPYTCLDATKDSNARYPPPRCHDKTRLAIRERLRHWLVNEDDKWRMLWVRGSAGTGKSAVAQSFGDSCEEEGIFGGSYFFSRTAGRNKLETVVPTIVYQLTRSIPEYHSLVERILAKDQLILRSSPPVQFRRLIVEPFSSLQHQYPRHPIVIILDGLDECEGEKAQRELLDMIMNAVRSNPNLPLRWLVFSRPEAHLKNAFSRNLECGREELVVDDECRENVERYVRDSLRETKAAYNDIVPADWPSRDKLQELLDAVSGLFVFASTCVNYIGDPKAADPCSQLDSLLTFMRRSQGIVSRNPLEGLDALYSRILGDILPPVFQNTRRILSYMSHRDKIDRRRRLRSAQALSNLLRLDQHAFYKAVRGLHSVMYIPESEDAAQSELKFHHTSFLDFLLDHHRSGKFAIGQQEALVCIIRSSINWYDVDVTHFHTDDGWAYDYGHKHDSLPDLTWASEIHHSPVSQSLMTFIEAGLFVFTSHTQLLNGVDEELLSQICNVDFRYWDVWSVCGLARLCRLDPSTSVVRIAPSSHTDHQLLRYFKLVIGNGFARPATFPLQYPLARGLWIRDYFFIGHGLKSVIVWITKSPGSGHYIYSLRSDQEPSGAQISEYRELLQEIEWDEGKARSELK